MKFIGLLLFSIGMYATFGLTNFTDYRMWMIVVGVIFYSKVGKSIKCNVCGGLADKS